MKNLIILTLCFLFSINTNGQELDHIAPYKIKNGIMYYELISNDTSLSKSQYFESSLKWLAKTFNDSKAVLEYNDKETGEIVGKGLIVIDNVTSLKFTVSIICKDGRAKIVIDNIYSLVTYKATGLKMSDSETRIERAYFKDGDVNKKPRDGFNKIKNKENGYITRMCDDWKSYVTTKSNSYSDF